MAAPTPQDGGNGGGGLPDLLMPGAPGGEDPNKNTNFTCKPDKEKLCHGPFGGGASCVNGELQVSPAAGIIGLLCKKNCV